LPNSEHIKILRRGPRVWNDWRQQNSSLVPNLDDAVLSLSERQMGRISGGPINLRSAQMRRAFLRFSTLSAAELEAADLSEADLAYARLDQANLKAANLSYAVLDHADFTDAILTDANLSGASLRHVQNLSQAQIKHSICDAATILPAHLGHPASRLEVERKMNSDETPSRGEVLLNGSRSKLVAKSGAAVWVNLLSLLWRGWPVA